MKLKKISINYSLIAFIAYISKTLVFSPTIADGIIVAVLAAAYGYFEHVKRFQPYNLDEEVRKDLTEVKNALSKLNMIRAADTMKNNKYF